MGQSAGRCRICAELSRLGLNELVATDGQLAHYKAVRDETDEEVDSQAPKRPRVVEPEGAAYSSLAELGAGEVGCLYETQRPRRGAGPSRTGSVDVLRFVRLDVRAELAATWREATAHGGGMGGALDDVLHVPVARQLRHETAALPEGVRDEL